MALLIVHGLCAVGLLGALTHQIIALFWKIPKTRPGFVSAVRSVRAGVYPTAIAVLYFLTFLIGTVLYPWFRVHVRTVWDVDLPPATGGFEIKEHIAAIGLGMLPAYLYAWSEGAVAVRSLRAGVTILITLIVWCDFLLGHILNNIRGLW